MSGLLIGVFCALDGVLFYVFFEATLIPMYFIIGIWEKKIGYMLRLNSSLYFARIVACTCCTNLSLYNDKFFSILDWHKFALDLPYIISICHFFSIRGKNSDVACPYMVA